MLEKTIKWCQITLEKSPEKTPSEIKKKEYSRMYLILIVFFLLKKLKNVESETFIGISLFGKICDTNMNIENSLGFIIKQ